MGKKDDDEEDIDDEPLEEHDHEHGDEVPDGAAVFPEIPEELGVHPLLLASLHSVVFLGGSSDEIVLPEAANEALEYLSIYLRRLKGNDLRRFREDLATLIAYGKQQDWPKQVTAFLKKFPKDFEIGEE